MKPWTSRCARSRRSSDRPPRGFSGAAERLDPLHASLMNGISSHVYDYDDTHAEELQPSRRRRSRRRCSRMRARTASVGPDFVHAFILGFEAESRVANAVYPAHYDVGWHITGTSGVFGAATAIGKLLGPVGAADGLGDRTGGDAGRRAARDVRVDGEGVSSGPIGAERLRRGAAGAGRLHVRRARHRRTARVCGRHGGEVRSRRK